MSGVEVFGLLASAVQLAEAGAKISTGIAEICRRVRNSPKELRSYTDSTQQLIDTARLIQPFDHDFKFPALTQHVQATLNEARNLQNLIQMVVRDYSQGSVAKRYWKAARGSNELELIHGLRRLEQEKSSLVICLSFGTTKQLLMLQASIDTIAKDMAKGRGTSHHKKNDMYLDRDHLPPSPKELQIHSKSAMSKSTDSARCDHHNTDIVRGTSTIEKQHDYTASTSIPIRGQLPQRMTRSTRKRPEGITGSKTNGHTYRRIKVGIDTTSVQGNVGDCHLVSRSRNLYSDIELAGKGIAIIGNIDGESFKTMMSSSGR